MGSVMKQIVALWKSTVEDLLHGVSNRLRKLVMATHYHPEKAYMRRRDDGGRDRLGSPDGGTSLRGSL